MRLQDGDLRIHNIGAGRDTSAEALAKKHGPTIGALKRGLYAETLRILEGEDSIRR